MAEAPNVKYFDGKDGLPVGWSKMKIASGRTVYLNHIDKSTTFQHPRKEGKDEEKKSGETPESISGALIHPIPGDANLGVSRTTSLPRGNSIRRPTAIDTPMRGFSVKSLEKSTSQTAHGAGSTGRGASGVGDTSRGAHVPGPLADVFKGGPTGAEFKVKTTVQTKMRRLFWKASKRLWIPSAFSIASSVVNIAVTIACATNASAENCSAGEGYRVIQLIASSICTGDSILITFARFCPSQGHNPTSTLILKFGIPLMTLVPPLQLIAFCYMLYVVDLMRKAGSGSFLIFIILIFGIATLVTTWAMTVPLFLLWRHAGEGPAYSWAKRKFPFLFPDDGREPDDHFLDLRHMTNMLGGGEGFSGDISDLSSDTGSYSSSSSDSSGLDPSIDPSIEIEITVDDESGSDDKESSECSSDEEDDGDADSETAEEEEKKEKREEEEGGKEQIEDDTNEEDEESEDEESEDEESEDEESEDEEEDFSVSGKTI